MLKKLRSLRFILRDGCHLNVWSTLNYFLIITFLSVDIEIRIDTQFLKKAKSCIFLEQEDVMLSKIS